jgi:predicted transcriptional regulator
MPKAPNSSTDIIEIVDPNLRAGFTQVLRLILRARGLSNTAKLVYALLLDYVWQQGSCYPGQQQLAADLDTTERTIQCVLIELRDYGLIARQRRSCDKPMSIPFSALPTT